MATLKLEDILGQLDFQLDNTKRKSVIEQIKQFKQYNPAIYREHNISEIAKQVDSICKLADKMIMEETDEWFDKVSTSKDMKHLKESVGVFMKTAKELSVLQQRFESCYEDIGSKLDRYFEIDD